MSICNQPISPADLARDLVLLQELEALLMRHTTHEEAMVTVRRRIAELEKNSD